MAVESVVVSDAKMKELVTLTHVIYGLYGAGLATGFTGIVGIVLNYIKREEVTGTFLESHFRWQIRTFWFGLLWVALCVLFIVLTLGVGVIIAWLPLGIVGLWFIYRIGFGWLRLKDRRPMYT